MSSLSDKVNSLAEGKIDFEGQLLADRLVRYSLAGVTAFSFLVGIALQSQKATFSIMGVSTFILAFIVLPPWPFFNHHPVRWLPSKSAEKQD